jgi:hypothetical protein
MTVPRAVAATLAGLVLGALPFVRYAHLGALEPHLDHEPRHGGQLGMVGEHHVELVRARGRIGVFVSDASRRPVRPRDGWVVADEGARLRLAWHDHRLSGRDEAGARRMDVTVVLDDGRRLSVGFEGTAPSAAQAVRSRARG